MVPVISNQKPHKMPYKEGLSIFMPSPLFLLPHGKLTAMIPTRSLGDPHETGRCLGGKAQIPPCSPAAFLAPFLVSEVQTQSEQVPAWLTGTLTD